MKYLLDSDWAIHHLRDSQTVTDQLKQRIGDGISISIISVAELYHGVYRARDPELAEVNLLTFLADLEIVGLNEQISNLFGRERARLQLQRTPIGDFDLLIGCTAVHYDLIVLTNNRKDFERIDAIEIETM